MEGRKQTSILSHFSPNRSNIASTTTSKQTENKHLMIKALKNSSKDITSSDRKTLKTIQLTKQEDSLTRGNAPNLSAKGKPSKDQQRIHTCEKAIPIYEDPVPLTPPPVASTTVDDATQTDSEKCWCKCHEEQQQLELTPEEEAELLMVQKDVPEVYWKELAEQRRDALNDTLEENEQLHMSLSELKEENRRLSELAEHGEKLAMFLTEVANDEEDKKQEEPEQESEPSKQEEETKDNSVEVVKSEETGGKEEKSNE